MDKLVEECTENIKKEKIALKYIHSVNSSYPMIGKVIEHIERCSIEWNSIEENNENKYLVLRSTDENK